jgi:hypothetical protein
MMKSSSNSSKVNDNNKGLYQANSEKVMSKKNRVGLSDITNVAKVGTTTTKINTPVKSMNLALLAKKTTRAYQAPQMQMQQPTPTVIITSATCVSPVSSLNLNTNHSNLINTNCCISSSPMGSGVMLPVDENFSSSGVNPIRFNRIEAARNALEGYGSLNNSQRISSPLQLTNLIQNYVERGNIMNKTNEEKENQLKLQQKLASSSNSNTVDDDDFSNSEASREWYEYIENKDASLQDLDYTADISTIGVGLIDTIETEYVQERLSVLEQANTILENKLVEERENRAKLEADILRGENMVEELKLNLRQTIDTADEKVVTIHTLQAELEERSNKVAEMEQVTSDMERMNGLLSEELQAAINMANDVNATTTESIAAASIAASVKSPLVFDALPLEEQERIKNEMTEDNIEMISNKQEVINTLENEINALNEQMHIQAEMLIANQEKIDSLEKQKITLTQAVGLSHEQKKVVNDAQMELNRKNEHIRVTELKMDSLENELKYKDEELMLLLQSSVQSSDIAANKLVKVEAQLTEKTTALRKLQEVNSSYLKNFTNSERKEQELMQIKETQERKLLEVQEDLDTALEEKEALTTKAASLSEERDQCYIKIEGLEESLKTAVHAHKTKVIELKESQATNSATTKQLRIAKTKIAELEGTIKSLRISTNQLQAEVRSSPAFRISSINMDINSAGGPSSQSPLTPAVMNSISNMNTGASLIGPTPQSITSTNSNSVSTSLQSTISLLESQVNNLEIQRNEMSKENEKMKENYEASQRDVESITDELHRSRNSLEKQLKSSTDSEAELANKVCGLNSQLEQLMNYSLKLTSELSKSKENELGAENNVATLETELTALRMQLTHANNPKREEEIQYSYEAQQREIEHWKKKLSQIETQYEKSIVTIEKAKQSKARRYNKYINLQQDYKLVVAQVERLVSENTDLRSRHKSFVKTVENALVGGEGKRALDKFNRANSIVDGASPGEYAKEARNRSILEMSQEVLRDGRDDDSELLSDIEEVSDNESSPARF